MSCNISCENSGFLQYKPIVQSSTIMEQYPCIFSSVCQKQKQIQYIRRHLLNAGHTGEMSESHHCSLAVEDLVGETNRNEQSTLHN